MRTILGNTSSILLGICLGSPIPLAASHILLQLLALLGLINADSITEAIAVSGQLQFVVIRVILAGCTVYATTFMVANLALSYKRLLAMVATLPHIFIALLATFGVQPETTFWMDSFGSQIAMIAALVNLIIAYLVVAWAGAHRGMQTQNIIVSRWAKNRRAQNRWRQRALGQSPSYVHLISLLLLAYYVMLVWN